MFMYKGSGLAKFQVSPEIILLSSKNMKPRDLILAEEIVEDKKQEIIDKWNQFFNKEGDEN